MTRNGASKAPTANKLCKKFSAAGLLPDTSFTVLLLKLEMLPRLIPVKKKAVNSSHVCPVSMISRKPTATKLLKNKMEFLRPMYTGKTPAMKPASRFPAWWLEISMPLTVSFN